MKLWIDEDLSPSLVDAAHASGLDATCSRDRGLLGGSDLEVLRRCIDEDRTLVTNNVGDFRRLCETRPVHPGLIVIPTLARAEQKELLANVHDQQGRRGQRGWELQRLCSSGGRVAAPHREKARLPKSPRIARKVGPSRAHSRSPPNPRNPIIDRAIRHSVPADHVDS